jgi:methoxymalonate biosynthesis acyl carrier protein
MSHDDATKQGIRDFLQSHFPQATINDADDLFALGHIDSIMVAELVMHIERTFDVQITVDEMSFDNLRSVDAMAAMIGRLRGKLISETA